jgi:hypothetical protein
VYSAPDLVKNTLSHAKKTAMLIGMMVLHPEKGGILAHRDLRHSEQWSVKSERVKSEMVND